MRLHRFAYAVLLLAMFVAVPSMPVSAAVPTCHGKPATHVMKEGDPPYEGTSGVDVVVGSPGGDSIDLQLSGGADIVCGNGGNDLIYVTGPGSIADGGAGNDLLSVGGGGRALGGSGEDVVTVGNTGTRGDGGSGDDHLHVLSNATGDGGSGNDQITGGENGVGAAALYGGSGADRVFNLNGNPKIDCGAAYDVVYANNATDVRRCEGTTTPVQ